VSNWSCCQDIALILGIVACEVKGSVYKMTAEEVGSKMMMMRKIMRKKKSG
jgi:CheY-specific phosphatase CheX